MKGPKKGRTAKTAGKAGPPPKLAISRGAGRARMPAGGKRTPGYPREESQGVVGGGDEEGMEGAGGEGEEEGAEVTGWEKPGYGLDTEEGRHIMELLEKHQESAGIPPSRRARPPAEKKFEIVEHTADVGIKAYGDSITEAFENAALGMFSILTDPATVNKQQDFEVMVEGENLKMLLHEWLSQLLVLSQLNGMLFSGFKVEMRPLKEGVALTGFAVGETLDPKRHVYKTEIKAVTHHMLEVRERPPMIKVLFDI